MRQTKAPRTLTLVERKAFRDAYRGKVLLDEANPLWPQRVVSANLHMSCAVGPCGCVLAQWAGDYNYGLDQLGISRSRLEAHYGFNDGWVPLLDRPVHRGTVTEITHLQRAWTYILRLLGR